MEKSTLRHFPGIHSAGRPAKQGRRDELKQLAVELMAAFEAREIYRESTAVLILFRRACAEERITAELARQLAGLLRQRKG